MYCDIAMTIWPLFFLTFRVENSTIGIKQLDFTDKWRIFDCTLLCYVRVHFLDRYVYPRETLWPWVQIKFFGCLLLEGTGITTICEPV